MMSKDKMTTEESKELWLQLRQDNLQHWRSWGSWFSWGSPVGLGIFFVLLSIAIAVIVLVVKL